MGFNASLWIPITCSKTQFCMSYYLHGHYYAACTCKALHMALTVTKLTQLHTFIGLYVATSFISGPTSPSNMWQVDPEVENDFRTSLNKDCVSLIPPSPPKPENIYCSGIPSLLKAPTKYSRVEWNYPMGTYKKKAWAMQQHLDPTYLGRLAITAKFFLDIDHEGPFVCHAQQCFRHQC